MGKLPNGLISFGKNANCTLALCPLEASILQYQPSIPGNGIVIGVFALSMLIHLVQGVKWRCWDFMICIIIGCVDEIIGYIGRIMLHSNPFSFNAFVIQIVCITTAPVFFCSAIYVLLSRTVNHLDRSQSHLNPKYFVWFFIPCDIVSLILQAAGGALSATQAGTGNKSGVKISMGGLVLQVVTLVIFITLFAEYVIRYTRKSTAGPLQPRMRLFLGFLFLSTIFVLVRCIYRIDELRDGYDGPLIRDEPLFMVLESAMMLLSVLCLIVSHPGIAFDRKPQTTAGLHYVANEKATEEPKHLGSSSE
ncbi:RTA1 like protein-domain-containing protein [Lasiosphaeris hirsuta]|uniref:RTA1 like protein-domain-containing protein n=1 Tax=Lasiosphaeris hirsuta TaxID=260670 RepID=A0AA40AI85_9PEZI|nr:RTA1 like protein-domain-containing protein [Lasiosphaeris hirsuta]